MRIRLAIALTAVTAAAAALTTYFTVETRRNRLVWDHFDVVKPGVLYRSGQLNPDQLREAIARYGLRTVVSFQLPGEGVARERAIAREMKVDFLNLPMPGDGFGREDQFRAVLAAVDDPARRPVLVHCARGTCRTGAMVALYRFERDGWTIDDVSAEMQRQTYRDGWLPGYVYNMVKTRPAPERFEPAFVHDRNLPDALPEPVEPAAASPATGPDPHAGHAHAQEPPPFVPEPPPVSAVAGGQRGPAQEPRHVR